MLAGKTSASYVLTHMQTHFKIYCDHDDTDHYVLHVTGSLLNHADDQVGYVRAQVLLTDDAMNDGVDPTTIADNIDQDTWDMWRSVNRENGDPRSFVQNAPNGNVLLAMTMEILPEYRKQNLGLLLLDATMRMFEGTAGLVVIEPHPVAGGHRKCEDGWRESMEWGNLASTVAEKAHGAKQLRKHWARLGFQPVPGSKQRFYYRVSGYEYPRVRLSNGEIQVVPAYSTDA